MSFVRSLGTTLEMIKWEHSIFALPFALTGAMLAAGGLPPWQKLAWIIVCMVTARSAAMAFNRWADADLDAANPRTRSRAIPSGLLTRRFVALFTIVMAILFIVATAQLNHLTFLLSPVALGIVLFYSYTKRFTRWAHLFLGLALGIAPVAAWIAVKGSLDLRILVLMMAVLFWVAGFDILYACQDFEHDRQVNLYSVPKAIGIAPAFLLTRLMHGIMIVLLIWLTHLFALGPISWVGITVVGLLLLYEHVIVSPNDLSRLNAAFFTMNGVISVVFFLFVAADLLLHR